MKLSLKWLGDFVTPACSPQKYAEALTMSGSKVEGFVSEGADVCGVVAGKITAMEKHPDADKLWVCQIEVGRDAPLQIVTGAQNVAVGDKVPVALDGATLPGGKSIQTGLLRGVESQGMLCSIAELGVTQNDFPEAAADGIFILDPNSLIGRDIRRVLGLDDMIFEFEITSNRPDCLSVIGLARETAVTFGLPFSVPVPKVTEHGGDINTLLRVNLQEPALCPRYCARVVRHVKVGPSPRFIRERLRASGVRPINNIVDITNYVMLETGQPMHAFDICNVQNGEINIRRASKGEAITTLDGLVRKLDESMLVIADAQKPVAVAGVMGGEFSGVTEDTATVVFESACFNGSGVRMTAKALGLRTDSSARFEKGLDPTLCASALDRACELVEQLQVGQVVSGLIDCDFADKAVKAIDFTPDWINAFLGTDISRHKMDKILCDLGFAVAENGVIPPSFRGDVVHKADVAEEIARFYGYDHIPTTPLRGSAEGSLTPVQKFEEEIARLLTACGFYEIVTYSFTSPKGYDKILLPADSPLRDCVTISNPLGDDTSVMRTTALPGMLEALARNFNNRAPQARLFELATEYQKTGQDTLPNENKTVMLGLYGGESDYYTIKGAVEELLCGLNVAAVETLPCNTDPSYHPGRCAQLVRDGQNIGILGELHPAVLEKFGLGARACTARLALSQLFALAQPEKNYTPLPRFPASPRDLALLCDAGLPVAELEKAIRTAGGELLESLELFDVYRGEQIPAGQKSVAYALSFRAADRTLTDGEIDSVLADIFKALEQIGATLRA